MKYLLRVTDTKDNKSVAVIFSEHPGEEAISNIECAIFNGVDGYDDGDHGDLFTFVTAAVDGLDCEVIKEEDEGLILI